MESFFVLLKSEIFYGFEEKFSTLKEVLRKRLSATLIITTKKAKVKGGGWVNNLQNHKNASYQVFKNFDMMRFILERFIVLSCQIKFLSSLILTLK